MVSTPSFNSHFIMHIGLVKLDSPYNLIYDYMDLQDSLLACRIFDFLEARLEIVKTNLVPDVHKGLVLLKISNELLRRLSKSENAMACGKILLFVSRLFPLCTRSGVNLMGAFNLENKTAYVNDPVSSDPTVGKSDIPDLNPSMKFMSRIRDFLVSNILVLARAFSLSFKMFIQRSSMGLLYIRHGKSSPIL